LQNIDLYQYCYCRSEAELPGVLWQCCQWYSRIEYLD